MKTEENIKLATVGELLAGLKKYGKKHWDDSVKFVDVDIESLTVQY